jgi:hypothetical protein
MKRGSAIPSMLVFISVAVVGLWVARLASANVNSDDPLAPLARGSLEVWVPDTFFRGMPQVTQQYQWMPLLNEFQNDFPSFELRFNVIGREAFVQAMRSSASGYSVCGQPE